VQATAQARMQSLDRARSRSTPAQRRAVAAGARRSAFVTASERRLNNLSALLNGSAGPVAQLVVAYDHDRKLYYNDESKEPPPKGYLQVDANTFGGGLLGAWTTSPPLTRELASYVMGEIISAIETGDYLRQQMLQGNINRGLSKAEAIIFGWELERRLKERQMEREIPDDSAYYLSLLDKEDPTPSEYTLGLMVKGIPGAEKLMEQYDTSSGGAKVGFEKQIEVTRKIEKERGLRAVEQNQSDITPRKVFVSADIVTSDKEGKDVLVEVKYWPGLESWDLEKQNQMAKQLTDQLMRYVATGKKVELYWLAALPDWLRGWLDLIALRSFGQVKIVTS
jgi:hypothetical protein